MRTRYQYETSLAYGYIRSTCHSWPRVHSNIVREQHAGLPRSLYERVCMCREAVSIRVKSKRLPLGTCQIRGFEDPEHVPRTSAGARDCLVAYTLVPCVLRG